MTARIANGNADPYAELQCVPDGRGNGFVRLLQCQVATSDDRVPGVRSPCQRRMAQPNSNPPDRAEETVKRSGISLSCDGDTDHLDSAA